MKSTINAKFSQVKLSNQARSKLRSAIRYHPASANYLHAGVRLSHLTKTDLLGLASELGIDPVVAQVPSLEPYPHIDLAEGDTPRSISDPFVGEILFDIAMTFLGKNATRQARIRYTHTPRWPYFDRDAGKEIIPLSEGGSYSLELLSVAESEITHTGRKATGSGRTFRRRRETAWEPCNDLTEVGICSEEMWEAIRDRIDRICRAQDSANRPQAQHDARIFTGSATA